MEHFYVERDELGKITTLYSTEQYRLNEDGTRASLDLEKLEEDNEEVVEFRTPKFRLKPKFTRIKDLVAGFWTKRFTDKTPLEPEIKDSLLKVFNETKLALEIGIPSKALVVTVLAALDEINNKKVEDVVQLKQAVISILEEN